MKKCEGWYAAIKALFIENFDEDAIDKEAVRLSEHGGTRRDLAKWILQRQQERTGPPSREIKKYAEIIAGAKLRRAASLRTIESAKEYHHDLVEILPTLDACDECADIQGKIYSISGDDPDFPPLTDDVILPRHPGCVHDLSIVPDSIADERRAAMEGRRRSRRRPVPR